MTPQENLELQILMMQITEQELLSVLMQCSIN